MTEKTTVDIREFMNELRKEDMKNSTQVKTLLWIYFSLSGIFTLVAIIIAVIAMFWTWGLDKENRALYRSIVEIKANSAKIIEQAEDAERAYIAAKTYYSRIKNK